MNKRGVWNMKEKWYEVTRLLITEGIHDTTLTHVRNYGVCIHHSYIPKIPEAHKNYGEIFHRFHFYENKWGNGLGYDFIISWWLEDDILQVKEWTSARWLLQLPGAHSLNTKGLTWAYGIKIKPNQELMSICIVGDYDKMDFPEPLYPVIKDIMVYTDVAKKVFLHSEFDHKTCPGTKFDKNKLEEILK